MAGLKGYLNKRKQLRLYNQWVNTSGLSPDEIPDDLQKQHASDEADEQNVHVSENFPYSRRSGTITVSLRFLFLIFVLIAILLVALSVITTLYVVKT